MTSNDPKDLIVIGGGTGRIVCLYHAKKAGLDTLLLERQSGTGGIWAQLPA